MENYTIDTLKAINESYDREHRLNQEDVDTANLYQALVARSRRSWSIEPGDIFITVTGQKYHVDKSESYHYEGQLYLTELSVCEMPGAYVPFIRGTLSDSRASISLCTSGGPWNTLKINKKNFEHAGRENRRFVFFGHGGAKGNGGVEFLATVNVWQETAPTILE